MADKKIEAPKAEQAPETPVDDVVPAGTSDIATSVGSVKVGHLKNDGTMVVIQVDTN